MRLRIQGHCRVVTSVAVSVALATVLADTVLAVGRDKAMYLGGTLSAVEKKAQGKFDTQSESELTFRAGKKGSVAIPYAAIASLEFAQKEMRAIVIGFGPPVTKELAFYLTITYSDREGTKQSGKFELGRDVVLDLLNVLETRSGKKITFQDTLTCEMYKTPQECAGKS